MASRNMPSSEVGVGVIVLRDGRLLPLASLRRQGFVPA
jgi:hypothetical protein